MIDRDRYIARIAQLTDVPFDVADDCTVEFRPVGRDPIRLSPGGKGMGDPDRDLSILAAWAAVRRMEDALAAAAPVRIGVDHAAPGSDRTVLCNVITHRHEVRR